MKQVKKKFIHESLQDSQSIKTILRAITQGLAKGKVVLSDDQGDVVLKPEGLFNLRVTASQDEEKNSLTLRINWQTERKLPSNKKLTVSSK